jgi:plasmid stabilization system protein ParE
MCDMKVIKMMNVSLTPKLKSLLKRKVETGIYNAGKLSESSEIVMNRPELGEVLRRFQADHYRLYYRSIQTGVESARVLHISRDIQELFQKSSLV